MIVMLVHWWWCCCIDDNVFGNSQMVILFHWRWCCFIDGDVVVLMMMLLHWWLCCCIDDNVVWWCCSCWLSLPAFYFGFLIPVAVIIIINTILFVLVIKGEVIGTMVGCIPITLPFLIAYPGGSRSTVVAHWTTGQQMQRAILHLGHDSYHFQGAVVAQW